MGLIGEFIQHAGANMGLQVEPTPTAAYGGEDSVAIQKSAAWPIVTSLLPRLDKLPFDSDLQAQAMVYATVVWVYVCAWEISSNFAGLDLRLFEGMGSEKKVMPWDHEALQLLEAPNPMESGLELREDLGLMLELTGNGYWEKVLGARNTPIKLFNLESFFMYALPDPVEKIKGWVYDMGTGKKFDFKPEQICQFKYANPLSQFYGAGSVQPLQTTVITELYREAYNKSFLENEARPDVILKQVPDAENNVMPITMETGADRTPLLRLAKEWRASFSGPRRSRLPVLLPPGIDISLLTEARQDMDFREMEKSLRERIISAFGVPPCLAGLYEYANYANVREQLKIFWTSTMPPKVRRMAATINRNVVTPYWPNLHVEFDLEHIPALEADSKEHTERVNSMFDRGGLTRREYRELLGRPVAEKDPHAEKVFMNSSYVLMDDVAAAPSAEQPASSGGNPMDENFSLGNNGGQLNG